MVQEFGSCRSWKSLIPIILVLYGIFSIPVTIFFAFIVFEIGFKSSAIIYIVLMLFALYLPYKHLKMVNSYAPIEYDGKYLIVTQPYHSRRLYEVAKITYIKLLRNILVFVCSGLPGTILLMNLDEKDRFEILKIMRQG